MKSSISSLAVFRYINQERSIIHAQLASHSRLELEDAKAIVTQRLTFTENRAHYMLADFSKVKSVTPEARKFLLEPEFGLKNIQGVAILAGNPLAVLIANIFTKGPLPFLTRFFTDEDKALKWIYEEQEKMEKILKS